MTNDGTEKHRPAVERLQGGRGSSKLRTSRWVGPHHPMKMDCEWLGSAVLGAVQNIPDAGGGPLNDSLAVGEGHGVGGWLSSGKNL